MSFVKVISRGLLVGALALAPLAAPAQTANNYTFNGKGWEQVPSCRSAVVSVTAGSTTQIVPLVAGQFIRVCGWSVSISTAGTAKWITGTGTNCGSNAADLTGATALAVGVPWSPYAQTGSILKTPTGFALCLTAATGNVNGVVSYAQYQ